MKLRPAGNPDGPEYMIGDQIVSRDGTKWTLVSIAGPDSGYTEGFAGKLEVEHSDGHRDMLYPQEFGLVVEE